MKESIAVSSLSALAQTHRLGIYRALVAAGGAGLTPGVLAEMLDLAPATLSFHLRELLQSGLVSQERVGRNLVYRADFQRMRDLLAFLTENCCAGEPCVVSEATTSSTCPC